MSKFIISSNLKNHIWKDLITNDIIALFELVKNSYDAEATHVTIEFLEDKIIISDNGYWMSYDDIEKKWLFVGYSSKVDTDNTWIIKETRNRRKNFQRSYAGAKWVGRFSCDRLWSHLVLYSKKEWGQESKLLIPRDQFEEDMNKEFWSIDINLSISRDNIIFKEGTTLIISNLRDKRDRQKKIRLKKQLMKLISPLEDNQDDLFQIEIISKDDLEEDEKNTKLRKKVNGIIINDTLETIKDYTVYINFSYDQWEVKLSLYDRGRYVFNYKKKSEYYDQLEKVEWTLYYLNRTAKSEFHKLMWEHNVQYGSIFLFKNTIRVYPFWEEWDDSFWLDKRKGQWYARYLWVRELFGYIDVKDHKNKLIEKTSRDWWFLDNETYRQLEKFILEEGVYKLEKYVVDALDWTESRQHDQVYYVEDKVQSFKTFIEKQLKEKNITINISEEFENIINEKDPISLLQEKTKGTDISKDVQKVVEQFKKTNEQRKEVEKAYHKSEKKLEEVENKAIVLERQNQFLQETQNISKEKIIWNIHDIGIIAGILANQLWKLFKNPKDTHELFKQIFLNIQKIDTISKVATRSDYKTNTWSTMTKDIIQFIHERTKELSTSSWIKLQYTDNSNQMTFEMIFAPIDINTILLNLTSNSIKARAKKINIYFEKNEDMLQIYYNDDGKWIDENIQENIFNLWITTTDWFGVGLFVVKKLIEDMGWSIQIANNININTWGLGWASFLIILYKKLWN